MVIRKFFATFVVACFATGFPLFAQSPHCYPCDFLLDEVVNKAGNFDQTTYKALRQEISKEFNRFTDRSNYTLRCIDGGILSSRSVEILHEGRLYRAYISAAFSLLGTEYTFAVKSPDGQYTFRIVFNTAAIKEMSRQKLF